MQSCRAWSIFLTVVLERTWHLRNHPLPQPGEWCGPWHKRWMTLKRSAKQEGFWVNVLDPLRRAYRTQILKAVSRVSSAVWVIWSTVPMIKPQRIHVPPCKKLFRLMARQPVLNGRIKSKAGSVAGWVPEKLFLQRSCRSSKMHRWTTCWRSPYSLPRQGCTTVISRKGPVRDLCLILGLILVATSEQAIFLNKLQDG